MNTTKNLVLTTVICIGFLPNVQAGFMDDIQELRNKATDKMTDIVADSYAKSQGQDPNSRDNELAKKYTKKAMRGDFDALEFYDDVSSGGSRSNRNNSNRNTRHNKSSNNYSRQDNSYSRASRNDYSSSNYEYSEPFDLQKYISETTTKIKYSLTSFISDIVKQVRVSSFKAKTNNIDITSSKDFNAKAFRYGMENIQVSVHGQKKLVGTIIANAISDKPSRLNDPAILLAHSINKNNLMRHVNIVPNKNAELQSIDEAINDSKNTKDAVKALQLGQLFEGMATDIAKRNTLGKNATNFVALYNDIKN